MKILQTGFAIVALLALAGCATQVSGAVQPYAPGFLMGLLHGALAPISFVGSLFLNDVAIYAVPNNGGWYDFGFLIGLCIWAGGGAAASS